MRLPIGLAVLVLSAALSPVLAGCGHEPSQELTAEEASGDPLAAREVTVFVLSDDVPRPIIDLPLVRETAWVRRTDGDHAEVVDAVQALLGHAPDRHRETLWHGSCAPGLEATGATVEKHLVTVRLRGFGRGDPGDAACDLSEAGWRAQRQQVAWTVRVALGRDVPVRVVLEDGYEKIPRTRASGSALDQPASSSPTSSPTA
jgi:hypothetical protein